MTPRIAVSTLFLINGFMFGNWAPQIPEFAGRHMLDESQTGIMIAIFGIGSLISMPLTGIAIARFGSVPATRLTSLITITTLLWLAITPEIITATIAIFIFGLFIAAMDVAMNALAVDVERKLAKPIMSSCHGFWSVGGLLGAVSGGYIIQSSGSIWQAVITTLLCAALLAVIWRNIESGAESETQSKTPIRFPLLPLPYLIGIVALFSAMPEGAVIDWSAFYMHSELGTNVFVSSFAFATFSFAMAVVRFLGDPVRARWGAVTIVRLCAITAACGFLIAGLSTSPFWVITGFAITGLGLSNLVPIAFSAAGNLPGLAPGIGISIVTTIGYSGVLVAPALLGYMAELTGFAFLFSSLSVLLIAIFLLSPLVKTADYKHN